LASIEKRVRTGGKVVYRVRWLEGGRHGELDQETFDRQGDAKRFKSLVDANGNRRPSSTQLREYGFDGLIADEPPTAAPTTTVEPAEPVVPVCPEPPAVTLEDYARDYVERLVKPSAETKRKYLERLDRYVFPNLGSTPMVAITRRVMREWQRDLIGGLSAKTIANVRGEVLYPMFEASCLPGEDDEPPVRSYNPLRGLPLPERIEVEREILETEEEARIFIEAAYAVDSNAAELLVTKLATGMRWGEIAGLPVQAVHPARSAVSIQQVVVREFNRWVVRLKPKTKDGYRELPVPEQVLHVLARRCEGREGSAFVFTAPEGNFWRYSQFYDGRWEQIRDLAQKNGLRKRMTLHALRHSLLTLLATEGINLAALREMAGHKRISTTFNVYVHATRKHHPTVRAMVAPFMTAVPSDQTG
jgi:integrase